LQFNRPQNAPLVREALQKAGREDLIGYSAECLVRPERPEFSKKPTNGAKNTPKNGSRAKAAPKSGGRPEARVNRGAKNEKPPKRGEKTPKSMMAKKPHAQSKKSAPKRK
jgi:hypothetical protein